MKLILLGYMGSGKSSVGKQLAVPLDHKFLDLDLVIEEREGKSIAALFRDRGEIYFRRRESEIVKSLIQEEKTMVLATGGGTPCYGDTMAYLLAQENVITIYLKASLEVLTERLFREQQSRPLIAHVETKEDLKDFIRKHLFERAFYYNQASMVIETDGLSVDETARQIIAALF